MAIVIYNSLSRKKEEFIPLDPPRVNMYTCGVTVYDDSHIGHARSLYTFEVIRRYLEYRGYEVRFVRNITDIDDKILNRAKESHTDWQVLIKRYIDAYYEDCAFLGVRKGTFEPRATENIPEMVKYIAMLVEKGIAYEAGGDVYFSVRKFAGYGKLSGQSIDQMREAVRIEARSLKQDPLDFALWKKSKEGEPSWESPWGGGRPGWHIECSVMSLQFLRTETLDIHAGGRDLIFPHHENEVAQAEALTGRPFARYWLHHGLLTINGQKMSKSLGNFITIKDFRAQYGSADFLKLFFLGTHYAHPIDYTDEKIAEARAALERIVILRKKLKKGNDEVQKENKKIEDSELKAIQERFIAAMDDDFNTPQAMACIFDLVTTVNKRRVYPIVDFMINRPSDDFIIQASSLLDKCLEIIGITLEQPTIVHGIPDKEVERLIEKRTQARNNKDYIGADKIRKDLEHEGIMIEDTPQGTTWRRKI